MGFVDHKKRGCQKRSGFSLVEIMIVLVIISFMLFIVIPSTNRIFRTELKSTMRKLGAVAQSVYSQAVFSQKLYRLVIDLNESEVWVEESTGVPMVTVAPGLWGNKDKPDEEKPKDPFVKYDDPLIEDFVIPETVEIEDVVNEAWYAKPISEGKVFIFFYPYGEMDLALIHLREKDGETRYTIEYSPISGAPRFYSGYTWYNGDEPPAEDK